MLERQLIAEFENFVQSQMSCLSWKWNLVIWVNIIQTQEVVRNQNWKFIRVAAES